MRHSVPRSSTPTAASSAAVASRVCRSGSAPAWAASAAPRRQGRKGGGARFGWCWEVSGEVEKNLVENMGRTLIGVLDHS